jgi:hypothetical protein
MLPSPTNIESLQGDGLASFTKGLRVSTCVATPSMRMSISEPPRLAPATSASFEPSISVSASRNSGNTEWSQIFSTVAPLVTEAATPTIENRPLCVVTIVVTTTIS